MNKKSIFQLASILLIEYLITLGIFTLYFNKINITTFEERLIFFSVLLIIILPILGTRIIIKKIDNWILDTLWPILSGIPITIIFVPLFAPSVGNIVYRIFSNIS